VLVFGGQDTNVRAQSSERRLLDMLGNRRREWTLLHHQANAHALHRDDLLDFLGRWVRG